MVGEGDFDWSEDVGFEALDIAEVFEDLGVSGAVASEVEVAAFDDDGGGVVFDDLIEEGFWVFGEEFWGWVEFDDLVCAGGQEEVFADLEWVDLGWGFVWVEGGHWVGVEGEDDDFAVVACVLSGSFDEHLVALVDAVEVADGEGGYLWGGWQMGHE